MEITTDKLQTHELSFELSYFMLNDGEGWDALFMNSYTKLMLDFRTKFSLQHHYRRRTASTLKRVIVFFLFGTF